MEHQDWNQVVWNKKKKPSYNHNPPGTAKFRALDGDGSTSSKENRSFNMYSYTKSSYRK